MKLIRDGLDYPFKYFFEPLLCHCMSSLLKFIPLVILNALIIVYVNCHAGAVHFPLLVSMLLSIMVGWLEPGKGWILAIIQVVMIWVFFLSFTESNFMITVNEGIAVFTTWLSLLTTFSGSLVGGMVKRNL